MNIDDVLFIRENDIQQHIVGVLNHLFSNNDEEFINNGYSNIDIVINVTEIFEDEIPEQIKPLSDVSHECNESFECPVCYCMFENGIQLNECKHTYCHTCITTWYSQKQTCPYCNKLLT
jgi:hypothetical protein